MRWNGRRLRTPHSLCDDATTRLQSIELDRLDTKASLLLFELLDLTQELLSGLQLVRLLFRQGRYLVQQLCQLLYLRNSHSSSATRSRSRTLALACTRTYLHGTGADRVVEIRKERFACLERRYHSIGIKLDAIDRHTVSCIEDARCESAISRLDLIHRLL